MRSTAAAVRALVPLVCTELGIDFYQIQQKTLSVLNPMKQTQPAFIAEADLAGPLVFALLFGATMLAVSKPPNLLCYFPCGWIILPNNS